MNRFKYILFIQIISTLSPDFINFNIIDIYDTYYGEIYNFLLRKTFFHKENAEDLTQNTFFNCLRYFLKNPKKIKKIKNKRAWVYKIAVNEFKQFLRNRPSVKVLSLNELTERMIQLPANNLFTTPTYGDFVAVMYEIQKLDYEERVVIDLKYFGKMKFKDISFVLGDSESKWKSKLCRAQKKLKALFNDNGNDKQN